MEQQRMPILITTVDLGDGNNAQVKLWEGDDPKDAAKEFCIRHGLPDDVPERLAEHLADCLAQAGTPAATPASYVPRDDDDDEESQPVDAKSQQDVDMLAEQAPCPADVHNSTEEGQQALSEADAEAEFEAFDTRGCEDDLPAAAGKPADARLYTAPSSPARRPGASNGTQDVAPPHSASSCVVQEDERLWGGESLMAMGQLQPSRRDGIFNRLYSHGRQREQRLEHERRLRDQKAEEMRSEYKLAISAKSHELAAGRTQAAGYQNYGHRMYVEGVLDQRRRVQLTKEAEEAKAAAELAEVKPAPRTSAGSRRSSTQDPVTGGTATWSRLTRSRTDKTQERLAELARDKEKAAGAECTFAPVINGRSSRLMADRSSVLREHRITAHEQLYQDAGRRVMRQAEYEYWYPEAVTFHPEVNPPRARRSSAGSAEEAPVQDRLYNQARRTADKLEAKRRQAPVDPSTGAPLFKPATGRAPLHARNVSEPVGEYLYKKSQEHANKKGALKAQLEQEVQNGVTAKHTTTASKILMGQLKAKRFRQVFEYMEQRSGSQGALDLLALVYGEDQALMDSLDEEVREDVEGAARLLRRRTTAGQRHGSDDRTESEAGAEGEDALSAGELSPGPANEAVTVDLPQFAELMEEVLKRAHHPRQYLLPTVRQRKKWEEPTFQPETNARSQTLAGRRRPSEERSCDILYKTAAVHESRRRTRREEALAAELQACTFKPEQIASAPRPRRPTSAASAASTATGSADAAGSPPPAGSGAGASSTSTAVPHVNAATTGRDAGDGAGAPATETSSLEFLVAASTTSDSFASADAPLPPDSVATERTTQSMAGRAAGSVVSSRSWRTAAAGSAHRSGDYTRITNLDAQIRAAMAEAAELLPDSIPLPAATAV